MKHGVGRPTKAQLAEEQIRRANGDDSISPWRLGKDGGPVKTKHRFFRIEPMEPKQRKKRPPAKPPANAPKLTPELVAKGQAKSLEVRRANSRNPQRIIQVLNEQIRQASIKVAAGIGVVKQGHQWYVSIDNRRHFARDIQDALIRALKAAKEKETTYMTAAETYMPDAPPDGPEKIVRIEG